MANQLQQNSGGIFTIATGVAGVKGAYVTAIDPTAFDAKWIWIAMGSYFGVEADAITEFDISTGLAGFEVDDYADTFYWGSNRATQNCQNIFLPVDIPAGSRISLRAKTDKAGPFTYHIVNVCITDIVFPKGDPISILNLPRTIIVTATGADGPIVEVTPSLPHKLDYMMIHTQSITNKSQLFNWDLMTGAAGLEFDRLGEMGMARNKVSTKQEQSVPWCGPVSFDAGERLSLRGKNNVSGASSISWQGIGFEYPAQ